MGLPVRLSSVCHSEVRAESGLRVEREVAKLALPIRPEKTKLAVLSDDTSELSCLCSFFADLRSLLLAANLISLSTYSANISGVISGCS